MAKQRATLEQAETSARRLGRKIKKGLPEGWGFVLLLTTYGSNGMTTYLSTCQRSDTIKLLRELALKLEKRVPEL